MDRMQTAAPAAVTTLAAVSGGLEDAYMASALATVRELLADPHLLDRAIWPAGEGYSRTLLHADPCGRFGVWALRWPPGCATPVHDHHCTCVFGVYRGSVEETLYRRTADGAAVETARAIRGPGYAAGISLGRPAIHRLAQTGEGPAYSIHIYGYDPDRFRDSIATRYDQPH